MTSKHVIGTYSINSLSVEFTSTYSHKLGKAPSILWLTWSWEAIVSASVQWNWDVQEKKSLNSIYAACVVCYSRASRFGRKSTLIMNCLNTTLFVVHSWQDFCRIPYLHNQKKTETFHTQLLQLASKYIQLQHFVFTSNGTYDHLQESYTQ